MRALKKLLEAIVPKPLLRQILSAYHFSFACLGAIFFNYPARKIIVVGVTGTKGKSSTTELLNSTFEESGKKTALLNSIRIKIAEDSERNLLRMTMPGRFYIQRFLSDAVKAGCEVAIVEMTSEGARQHRHRFLEMNALIFTNLAPEHIESHGSYENYANAKFEIARELARSHKRLRIIAANADDRESARYLSLPVEISIPFSLSSCQPWSSDESGGRFRFDNLDIHVKLPGEFSLKNALASATVARAFGIPSKTIRQALEKIDKIPGRAEQISEGQDFTVVVDYAHTPDSLQSLYNAYDKSKKICVLGATGGGRDVWKRPVMGAIADSECDVVILTNEDPYDENPREIVNAVAKRMKREPKIIMDRREAIRHALMLAKPGDAVLITGKGTDPCICVENGKQIPWSDADVAREELKAIAAAKV